MENKENKSAVAKNSANNSSSDPIGKDQVFKMLVMVAVLLCLLFVASKFLGKPNSSVVNPSTSLPQVTAQIKTDVDPSKIPDKFPANIPLEAGTVVTQNYNVTNPDGGFQATRAFYSHKTLAESYKIYKDFLDKDGWTISASTDDQIYKMLMGDKGKSHLQITMNDNQTSKSKSINITYVLSK